MNYYLNRIYFGKGYFGVGAAARGYFGKDASQLTVPECALLAGIIRAPHQFIAARRPRKGEVAAQRHAQADVRLRLHQAGRLLEVPSRRRSTSCRPSRRSRPSSWRRPSRSSRSILQIEGTEEMPQGLTVHTNIDLHLQAGDRVRDESRAHESGERAGRGESSSARRAAGRRSGHRCRAAAIVADVKSGRVQAWVWRARFLEEPVRSYFPWRTARMGALLQPVLYALGFDRLDLDAGLDDRFVLHRSSLHQRRRHEPR